MSERSLQVEPVTSDRWNDLRSLFGERGAYGNCWCMWWRVKASEFDRGIRGGNRKALKRLVDEDRVPGLLAYAGDAPVGWCSLGPRDDFGRVLRSPTLKPRDDVADVWSLVCFYIDRRHRRTGVAAALLEGAIDFARDRGASWLEAYPVDPAVGRKRASAELYTGVAPLFRRAGFEEIARRSEARPIMRRRL